MENREIKFRAFDKEGNEYSNEKIGMISLDEWYLRYGYQMSVLNRFRGRRYVYMQWTGLHDKNGVEIYEGDIVRCLHKLNQLVSEKYDNIGYSYSIVEFLNGQFIGTPKKYDASISTYFGENSLYGFLPEKLTDKSIEVIGNIYENPELLQCDGK